LYYQLVRDMRLMYHVCKLVHADLSEYNILYHAKKLYIIDVSQSVEHDHPYAIDFLRHDCNNVTEYFRKRGNVRTMSLRRLFEFITDFNFGNSTEEIDEALAAIQLEMDGITDEELNSLRADDEVFRQSYIPRTLDEVIDYERDVKQINEGKSEELIYSKLVGLNLSAANTPNQNEVVISADAKERNARAVHFADETEAKQEATLKDKGAAPSTNDEVDSDNENENDDNDDSEEDETDDEDGSDEEDSNDDESVHAGTKRPDDKNAKKEHKQAVKEANREKRKTKIPKFVKKRKERMTSGKKSK
ncbi:Serine/threonine-protein kinase rio1, partial [Kickxella alabastrina]